MELKLKREPYIKEATRNNHWYDLIYIEQSITEKLNDYPNFDGIDFSDVSAGGIQIRGFHKEIQGYTFGNQVTVKYDFTNVEECIQIFINMWKKYDVDKYVKWYKGFLKDGDKYGWD
jgi:hypothetical protein